MAVIKRVLIAVGCVVLLLISWLAVVSGESDADKQSALLLQAEAYLADEIYIRALPLLEEAAAYKTPQTTDIKLKLKDIYLVLGDRRAYTGLLDDLMADKGSTSDVFAEAAQYYLGKNDYQEALGILTDGISKTGDSSLEEMYEQNRYRYQLQRNIYDDVTAIHGGFIQVCRDGLWGLATGNGNLFIPCDYDKVSTFDSGNAVVRKDGIITAVDNTNRRTALLKEAAEDFGNLAGGRVSLLIDGSWVRATAEFQTGTAAFEAIGTYSNGYAAVKTDGKWGVVDYNSNYLVPPEYDEIVQDELGKCYAQGVCFVRQGGSVHMFTENGKQDEAFEDARPFADGYAAVKKDGKWGFVDASGTLVIPYSFDDALSFGMHLAAVKQGGKWGYISKSGKTVIEPVFMQAKSFYGGSAPVLTNSGWTFISLEEYVKGVSL